MKVKFLKHHLRHKPGDEVDIDDNIANYLLKVGVATIETPSDEVIKESLNKKLKAVKKKK